MKILITGAAGFVGRYAAKEFANNGYEVIAFDANFPTPVKETSKSITGDLCDSQCLENLVKESAPDACLHLAAISSTPEAKANPGLVFEANVCGTIKLLEAFRKSASTARFLFISTSNVYGHKHPDNPLKETDLIEPDNIYGVSKAAADLVTSTYAKEYNMHTMTARPTNHVGPGQSKRFVLASFANQLKEIAKGAAEPLMHVGNLESERYFGDVRDIVRAYRLLIEEGKAGEAYNISNGNRLKIGNVLNKMCDILNVKPKLEVDQSLFRPTDKSPALDISKLQEETAWKPEIELDQTLQDILST